MARNLYAVHDWATEWAAWVREAGVSAWCVTTHELKGMSHFSFKQPDFEAMATHGVTPIARLNHSHHGEGTIPPVALEDVFAEACAGFAAANLACRHFIVGNEPNHPVEWGGKTPVTPARYAECYLRVYGAVKAARPDAVVMPAAIAPWSIESGMGWVEYFAEMLHRLDGSYDAINLHTYSRGYMPAAVTAETRMDPPWDRYRSGFLVYRDFMSAVPADQRHKPVHITETNGNGVWPSDRSGWVQAAYAEIDAWNQTPGTQKIHSLALFRWPKFDRNWQFETKRGVHDDFRAALSHGYRVPDAPPAAPDIASPAPHPSGNTLFFPSVQGGGAPPPPAPPAERDWDPRLTERGVSVKPCATDRDYFAVVHGRWFDPTESGGRHHILVDVQDAAGRRVPGVALVVTWPGGSALIETEEKPGEPWAAAFAMSPSRNEFAVAVHGREGEQVTGIGMGADLGDGFNAGHHTATGIVWRLVPAQGAQPQPTPPSPEPQPAPVVPGDGIGFPPGTPIQVTPSPPMVDPGHVDPRVLQAILMVESGGRAFGNDGRMVIRLENHILAQRVPAPWYEQHFRHGSPPWTGHQWRPSATAPWRPMHTGKQADEWDPFLFASQFYPEQAAQSISMGSAQIVGFNHAKVGYPSARAMFEALGDRTHGETTQMIAFFAFLLNTTGMLTAIRHKDWRDIARLYNGPGAVETYAPLLERTYRQLAGK